MKRFLLITTIALCILTSLAVSSGTVHAQTTAHLAPQRATIANDQSSYPFWAGGWGYGYCFSHSDMQAIDSNNSQYGRFLLNGYMSWRFGGAGFAASSVLEGIFWYLKAIDRGNGDCIAWAYGQWWLPVAWGR